MAIDHRADHRDEAGTDTPTGTDPDARYEQPGYEDKSFGQAVDADRELAEEIKDHDDPDAEFEERSAGAPAIARQKAQAGE
jgi:hypothetical protein